MSSNRKRKRPVSPAQCNRQAAKLDDRGLMITPRGLMISARRTYYVLYRDLLHQNSNDSIAQRSGLRECRFPELAPVGFRNLCAAKHQGFDASLVAHWPDRPRNASDRRVRYAVNLHGQTNVDMLHSLHHLAPRVAKRGVNTVPGPQPRRDFNSIPTHWGNSTSICAGQHGQGQYERGHHTNVFGLRLVSRHIWVSASIILLGLHASAAAEWLPSHQVGRVPGAACGSGAVVCGNLCRPPLEQHRLCAARAAVGLGEAVAPTAAIDMVANAVPAPERSRAVSFIFGGLHVGSILGLLACPWLIHNWGWQSVFFSFGASGLLWAAWFQWLRGSWQRHDPQFAALLQDYGPAAATQAAHSAEQAGRTRSAEAQPTGPAAAGLASQPIPYRAFLRSRPVQALGVTHFCHNFLHYTTSATAGPLADWLISRGLPVPRVRKAIQGTSFLAPLALLLLACTEHVVHDRTASVACITAALGLSSFSLAGLYCTPQDLSPKYASALLSMSNTAGALPGVIGVTL
ncbi:MFS domain-containing protein, partial [Haematococcus lacustris]